MADIGLLYPGWQSGTATLSAGSVVVTFPRPFKNTPAVYLQNTLAGTTDVTLFVGGVGVATFVALSIENLTGGTLQSGTTGVSTLNWIAHVQN